MRKKKHRSGLKWKIQRSIILVWTGCMFVSTLIGSAYYLMRDRRQKVADERSKLQHLANELEFMTEEVESFGKSVVADEQLRALLSENEFQEVFAEIRHRNEIVERLNFYNGLRSYIAGTFVEMNTGGRYTSNISSSMNQEYMERKLSVPEFQEFKCHEEWRYSKPYKGIELRDNSSIICSRIDIWSDREYGRQEGVLYLEIYLEELLKSVQDYGNEYENMCLTGAEGIILYSSREGSPLENYLRENGAEQELEGKALGTGSLILLPVEKNGWTLYVFISDWELWSRIWRTPVFLIFVFFAALAVMLSVSSRILGRTIRPITCLSREMEQASYDRLPEGEFLRTGDEIEILYDCYRKMLLEIQRGVETRLESEKRLQEMRFDIMLSQINPHYLYNVLNTVIYLSTASRNQDVVRIVRALIRTLQTTLEPGTERTEVSVEKELELTETYLDIQRYRYPGVFTCRIHCGEEEKECLIPRASIQPLVENALVHGILPTEEEGHIEVSVRRQGDVLKVSVKDDGGGIDEGYLDLFRRREPLPLGENGRQHIGLANIRERIAFLYGEGYGMEIASGEMGTVVELILPIMV